MNCCIFFKDVLNIVCLTDSFELLLIMILNQIKVSWMTEMLAQILCNAVQVFVEVESVVHWPMEKHV